MSIDGADLAGFIETSFIAMNEICIKVGMSDLEVLRLSENAMTYFYPEFTAQKAEALMTQRYKKKGPKPSRPFK